MRKTCFFVMFIFIVLFTSCSYTGSGKGEKISAPENTTSNFYGRWGIAAIIFNGDNPSSHNINDTKDMEFTLDKKVFATSRHYWNDVQYKSKLINLSDYIKENPRIEDKYLKNVPNEFQSITVIQKSKHICDFALISSNEAIVKIGNKLLKVKKISSSTKIDISKLTDGSNLASINKAISNKTCGLLLGLKSNKNNNISYRTVWVSYEDNKLNPTYELNSIIFPRKSSFWKLTSKKITRGDFSENIFIPENISKPSPTVNIDNVLTEKDLHGYKSGNIEKELTFVSPDYISVNITGNAKKSYLEEPLNKLHIYPISSLPHENSISTYDLLGKNSAEYVKHELYNSISKLYLPNDSKLLNSDEQDYNFGVERRNLHWLYTGKIPIVNNGKFESKNYDINVLPSTDVVPYDNSIMTLNKIRETIPDAKDAFSSPYGNIIVVLTDKYIYIYKVDSSNELSPVIDSNPIGKIKLKNGEVPIMSEWSCGDYTKTWDKTIQSIDGVKKISDAN